jgi:hypothetical protein
MQCVGKMYFFFFFAVKVGYKYTNVLQKVNQNGSGDISWPIMFLVGWAFLMDKNLYYEDARRPEVLALLIDGVLFDRYRFLCKVFMFLLCKAGSTAW